MKHAKKILFLIPLTASLFMTSLPVNAMIGKAIYGEFSTDIESGSTVSTVAVGSSVYLNFYCGGTLCTPDSVYSSDPSVATVDSSCLVTGISPGTATITATLGYGSTDTIITVTGGSAQSSTQESNTQHAEPAPASENAEASSSAQSSSENSDFAESYVLADSASRYLTEDEVQKLTCQQACYAKNEIYARHGRKFNSVELQQFFGAKSWYKGEYDPAVFDAKGNSVFNRYELANIDLIKNREFSLAPSGYQLDQPGYDIYAGQPDSAAVSYTSKEIIKSVQEMLNTLGYSCGTPDGLCGPATQAQIRAYQTNNGMEATGTIDEALYKSLENAKPRAVG